MADQSLTSNFYPWLVQEFGKSGCVDFYMGIFPFQGSLFQLIKPRSSIIQQYVKITSAITTVDSRYLDFGYLE